jgi:hypothetical protein
MKLFLVMLFTTLFAPHLGAQGTVVLPEAPLDSARAALRDELVTFRDSLGTIDAAAARLHRDYRQASSAVLRSRARLMTDACARSVRGLPRARRAVQGSQASDAARRGTRKQLLQAMDRLGGVLAGCETEFGALSGPGKGEEVRGYGNHRAIRIQSALREYERVLARYLHAMGIRIPAAGLPRSSVRG